MMLTYKFLLFYPLLVYKLTEGQVNLLKCDFSGEGSGRPDTCSWSPAGKNQFSFIDGKPRQVSPVADGPLSSRNFQGSFIQLKENSAALVSPAVKLKQFCLSFYYYLFGLSAGELFILRTDSRTTAGGSEIIYYRNQEHENIDKWHHFQETINNPKDLSYFYTLRAKREDGTQIAIDNIAPTSEVCKPTRYYCDFDLAEDDELNCPWLKFETSDKAVSWTASYAQMKEYDIEKDHSSRSVFGSYLTAKGFKTAPVDTTWSIVFPQTDSTSAKHCLSFWVYQHSLVDLTLQYEEVGKGPTPITMAYWHSVESNKPFWSKTMLTISKSDYSPLLNLRLEMKKLDGSDKPIGIDSISFVEGKCPEPATCDFDENFCGFVSPGSKWLIGRGRVANPKALGPNFEPPMSTSRYAYVDFSLSSPASNATLISEEVSPGDYCLNWNEYHSKFEGHTFEIHVVNAQGEKLSKVYERINGLDSGTWNSRSESVLAVRLPKSFRLMFVVQSNLGFTALDDIELKKDKCVTKTASEELRPIEPVESCDFEKDMCDWQNEAGTSVKWQVNSGRDWSRKLPIADTTIKSNRGHFVHFSTARGGQFKAALSKSFSSTPATSGGKYCFALQTVVRGGGTKSLTINIKTAYNEQDILVLPSNKWKLTEIDLQWNDLSKPIAISLKGEVNSGAVIAVDDIMLYAGACQRVKKHIYECGFHDYDNCEISIDRVTRAPFAGWVYKDMKTHLWPKGGTIVTEIASPSSSGRTRFYLPRLRPRVKTCLTFWYLMKAAEGVTFRVLLEKGFEQEDDDQTSEVIFEARENNGDNWMPTRVEIADEAQWRLAFEVEVVGRNTFSNRVAIDDIIVQRGACPSYYSCNLEDDSCLWHNMEEGIRANGYYSPSNTWAPYLSTMVGSESPYPSTTAAGTQGSYFLSGTSRGPALLLSPRFDFPADEEVKFACLSFFDYFVDTHGGGTIFLARGLTETADVVLNMHEDGSPSHQWVKKSLEIPRADLTRFWLVFIGFSDFDTSFNALDDIRLEFGRCPVEEGPFVCDRGAKSIPRAKVCDFVYDCDDKTDETQCGYSCDYSKDKNRCGWTAKPGKVFTVSETSSSEPRMRIRNLGAGEKAVLESPVLKKSISTCSVTFKASYAGKRAKVIAEISVEGQDKVEIWSSDYLQPADNPDKAIAKFSTGKINNEFRLSVSVIALNRIYRDNKELTLSSVEFDKNCFLDLSDKKPCPENHFKCDNGRCIAEYEICNLRDNCGDNSDESDNICKDMDTRSCDFSSFCFFEDEPRNKTVPFALQPLTGFQIRQGFDEISKGPTRDNTANSEAGWFAHLPPSSEKTANRVASLTADQVMSECATFFTFSRGDVTLKANNLILPIMQEPIWQLHYIGGLDFHNPLIISATTSDTGYLAIDDFSWGTQCDSKYTPPVIKPTKAPTIDELQIYDQLTCDFNGPLYAQKWTLSSGRASKVSQADFRATKDGPLGSSALTPRTASDSTAILFQIPTPNAGENSLMSSFVKMSESQDVCFTFDYYFFGNLGNFQLIQYNKDNTETYLFHRNQEYANVDTWKQYSLNIPRTKGEFRLVASMNFGSADTTFAFDNFVATPGKCDPKKNYCDFDRVRGEELGCDWLVYEDSDEVKWSAKFPGKLPNGPAVDHSSKSIYGRYLTAVAVKSISSWSTARLYVAEADASSGERCLTFWYFRDSASDDTLKVTYGTAGAVALKTEETLFTAQWRGQQWKHARVNLPAKNEEEYSFAISITKYDTNPKSVVAIDSILLTPGECFEPLSCDFNFNMCGYTAIPASDGDPMPTRWLIGQGRLYDPSQIEQEEGLKYTAFASPEGMKAFAYVDLTAPNLDSSKMYSLTLQSDTWTVKETLESTCLRFKYYLFGQVPPDSSFYAHVVGANDAHVDSQVWSLEKPKRFQWVAQEVNIFKISSNAEVQISFVLKTKPRPFVIGLADVDVTPGIACDGSSLEQVGILGPQSMSCNFDDGTLCSWKTAGNQQLLWKVSDGDAISKNKFLPRHDHTSAGLNGSYAYASTSRAQYKDSRLELLLTDKLLKPGKYCMSLWSVRTAQFPYASISVTIDDAALTSTVTNFVPKSNSWTFFELDFVKEDKKDLKASIVANTGSYQVNAIDDIEFHRGACDSLHLERDTLYHCSFEGEDYCGIAIGKWPNSGLHWNKEKDALDHTNYLSRFEGHSMMMKASTTSTEGWTTFYTRYVHPREPACVTLWYKMETKADPSVKLAIKLLKNEESENVAKTEEEIFSDSGYRGLGQWYPFVYQVDYEDKWRLAISVSYEAGSNRDQDLVAVDDIVIKRGECPSVLSCDFNDDNCPWVPLTKFLGLAGSTAEHVLDLRFTRIQSSLTHYPLPPLDSQKKPGNYMILSGKRGEGVLRSPRIEWPAVADPEQLNSTDVGCFSLWAYNSDRAELDIHLGMNFDGAIPKLDGQKLTETKKWQKLHFKLDRKVQQGPYLWLYILGYVDESSYLAIDDLSVEFGESCPSAATHFICANGKWIDHDMACNFKDDCDDGSDEADCSYECDFLFDSLCGYRSKSEFASNRWSTATPAIMTKLVDPPAHFAFAEHRVAGRAELQSKVYRNSGPMCYFKMRKFLDILNTIRTGLFTVELSVDSQRRIEVYDGFRQMNLRHISQKTWHVESAFIGEIWGEFQLIISLEMNGPSYALAAIDHLEFVNCYRSEYVEFHCEGKFKCKNLKCIPLEQVCDGQDDCEDGSDESPHSACDDKLRCNFENPGFCGSSASNFQHEATKRHLWDGPTRDHTSNWYSGSVAFTKSPNASFKFVNPDPKSVKCITFYVQAWTTEAKLTVDNKPYSIAVDKPGFWQQINAVADGDVNVDFTKADEGWIAVDDVIFKKNCAPAAEVTTLPSVHKLTEVDYPCRETGGRVPKYTVCDDVLDCPLGEDETKELCGELKCATEGIYCQRKSSNKYECLNDVQLYCDGKADCVDGSDEDPRLCNSDIWCDGFCQRNGECKSVNGRLNACTCKQPFYGKRCQYPDVEPEATTPQALTTTRAATIPAKPATKAPPVKPTKGTPDKPAEATTEKIINEIESPKKTKKSSAGWGAMFGLTVIVILLSSVTGYFLYTKRPWQRDTNDDTQVMVSSSRDVQMDEVRPSEQSRGEPED